MAGAELIDSLWQATLETLYMVSISAVLAVVFGLPLGLLLVMTSPGNVLDNPNLNRILGAIAPR